MVINLRAHGLNGRAHGRGARLGASTVDDLVSYAKSAIGEVVSDPGVKARFVSEAIKSVTGIAPTVDTRDPKVTWVRTVPKHADWIEAVFLKSVQSDPNSRPANLKVDVMPAVTPVLLKRVLPVLLLLGAGVFAAGYFVGKD